MVQIEITKQPLYGSVEWNGYEFVYTPREGFTGNDIYYYKKTENGVINSYKNYVNPTNLPPITRDISLVVDAFSATTINFNDIITDTTNPFNELKIVEVTPVTNGRVETDGTNIYYHPNTANTVETFIYTVTDKQFIDSGTITLSVINGLPRRSSEPNTFKYRFYKTYNSTIGIPNLTSNWDNSYDTLTTYQDVWNNIDVSRFVPFANAVIRLSSDLVKTSNNKQSYDDLYSALSANSGLWINDISIIDVPKYGNQNWDNTYSLLTSNSSTWNNNIITYSGLSSSVENGAENYDSFSSTVNDNITSWNSRGLEVLLDNKWDISSPIVQSSSSNWDNAYNNTTAFSSTFDRESKSFNLTFETLTSNVSTWSDRTAENAILSAPKWNAVYNNKVYYDNTYSYLTSTSANLISDTTLADSLTSSVSAVSANIITSYQTITAGDKINYWNALDNVSALSSEYDYNISYSLLTANSGYIETLGLSAVKLDEFYDDKSIYDNLYSYLTGVSGDWIKDRQIFDLLLSSDNYNNTYNLLTGDSKKGWDEASYFTRDLLKYNFNSITNIVSSKSAIYDNLYSNISSDLWDSVYNTVFDTSAIFAGAANLQNVISTDLTAKYYSLYDTLTTYGDTWTNIASALSVVNLSAPSWNSMGDNVANYNLMYSTVTGSSATFVSATTGTSGLSATISTNVSSWNSMIPIINSSNIQENYALTDAISASIEPNKIRFESVYNTITANARYWPGLDFYNILSATSSWDASDRILFNLDKVNYWSGYVTELDSTRTAIQSITSINIFLNTFIKSNSGLWFFNQVVTDTVSSSSARWSDSYNITETNSALWTYGLPTSSYNNTNNFVSAVSGRLRSSYTTLTTNSATLWLSATSVLNSLLSTRFLTGSPTIGFSARNLNVWTIRIGGNLSTFGPRTILNSSVQLLSGFFIDNTGNTNALLINKNGTNAIINFQTLTSPVLYVKASPPVVGINLSAALTDPTISLTVSGDISASGFVYPYPEYVNRYALLSSRYESTFSFVTANSGRIITYQNFIPVYDLFLTYIPPISSFLNVTVPYYNTYNIAVSSYGTKTRTLYNFVTAKSATWYIDPRFRSNQYKYDSSYEQVTSISANYAKYNFSYFFSSKARLSAKKIDFVLQDNIKILSWRMTSDVSTIASIDVLSSDYVNYERNGKPLSIVNGNYPSLNSDTKNTMDNLNSIWIGDYIPRGSILRFHLTNNTAASAILIDLVVQKQ